MFIKISKFSKNFKISWGNSKCVVPETLTIDRGEAEVNSQGRGDNTLAIPEYTVYKYFIIPKNIKFQKFQKN
jgi:hypothetical protein